MVNREIPSTDWQPFLESFTLQHDGSLTRVSFRSPVPPESVDGLVT